MSKTKKLNFNNLKIPHGAKLEASVKIRIDHDKKISPNTIGVIVNTNHVEHPDAKLVYETLESIINERKKK